MWSNDSAAGSRNQGPGLSFKIPFGIEKVTKVNVMEFQTEEFGTGVSRGTDRFDSRSRFQSGSSTANVALMLTGDLNVAEVPWIVQYRIKDPKITCSRSEMSASCSLICPKPPCAWLSVTAVSMR